MPSIFGRKPTVIEIVRKAGLADANLQICLDAGDINSYPGGQTWYDTSGKGHNFWLGTSAAVDAAEPTFVGVPGNRNSYFAIVSGGCNFQLKTANPSWVNALHTSTGQGTSIIVCRSISPGGYHFRTDTMTGASGSGLSIGRGTTETSINLVLARSAGVASSGGFGGRCPRPMTLEVNGTAWKFTGAAVGNNTVTAFHQGNARTGPITTSLVANANAASIPMGLADLEPGDPLYAQIIWNRMLEIPEIERISRELRKRFQYSAGGTVR